MSLLLLAALGACTAPVPASRATVPLTALAGPTCPVVSDPPDPACADRPVEGAEIVVEDEAGVEIARVTTDEEGAAVVELPPGTYVLVPQPVEGLLGTAPPVTVTLVPGTDAEAVTIAYDTGIR